MPTAMDAMFALRMALETAMPTPAASVLSSGMETVPASDGATAMGRAPVR
jgi:hypothetical protein